MNLIPYEQFTIDGNALKKLQEHYTNRKIKEYFKNHGVMPNSGTVESFVIPPELMDEYKQYYYADYCQKEVELEKKYGPSEMIETSFDFSTVEDSGSTILGASPLRLGASASGDNEEYQYEYWSIAVMGHNADVFGTFTSLNDISIPLNSLKKYQIWVYHRKSNYQYDIITSWEPVDNMFHRFTEYHHPQVTDISNYYEYQTQAEDKEYIGIINDYVPMKGGIIKGSLYKLNPRMVFNISGLTEGLTWEFGFGNKQVDITCEEEGVFSTNGDSSKVTVSGSIVSYLATKEDLVNRMKVFAIEFLTYANNIESPKAEMLLSEIVIGGHTKDGKQIDGIMIEQGYTAPYYGYIQSFVRMFRNDISYLNLYIPPQGEDIDTGFDFDVIDD